MCISKVRLVSKEVAIFVKIIICPKVAVCKYGKVSKERKNMPVALYVITFMF